MARLAIIVASEKAFWKTAV